MTPKENSWSIVIAGFWNKMIFCPKWVGAEIFEEEKFETLIAMQPNSPIIYQIDDVRLDVEDTKIVFRARKHTDECMVKIEKMACKTLNQLQYTPISAVGINYEFIENHPPDPFLHVFNFSDNSEIGTRWNVNTSKISRQLVEDNLLLNLSLTLKESSIVEISGNFHSEADSPSIAHDILKDKTIEMKNKLVDLISEVYHISIEEPDQDD